MIEAEGKKPARAAASPKLETPKFELPKAEFPEAFRQLAEQGLTQAKDAYTRMRTAAEEATDLMEDTYTTATKGAAEFNLRALEAVRANVNAGFDFAREMAGTKTLAEAVELSASYMRKQFDALSSQTKDLSLLAQRIATEAAEPIKTGVSKSFKLS
jgi:phasin